MNLHSGFNNGEKENEDDGNLRVEEGGHKSPLERHDLRCWVIGKRSVDESTID